MRYLVYIKFKNDKRKYKFKCDVFERFDSIVYIKYGIKSYEINFNNIDYYTRIEVKENE